MAKITLFGMETFLKTNNESVFDNLVLPAGINKNDLVDNILLRAGEFEVLYASPNFLKEAISLWGRKHYRTFEKWYNALQIDYEPLENYDRVESWTDTKAETSEAETSGTTSGSQSNSSTDSNTITNKVSAYDSSDFSNKDKSEVAGNVSSSLTNSGESSTSSNSSGNENATHEGRIHGNIGVTTSQQMLQSELDISKWNLIEQITDLYITEFCVAIY